MDLNIKELLFPNPWTMLAQLCATFIIYLLYKKFLHEPVQAYLAKRADRIVSEVKEAETLKADAQAMHAKTQEEYASAMTRLKSVEATMLEDATKEKQAIIDSAQDEINALKNNLEKQYETEKSRLYGEVSNYMLEAAVAVNKKVLEGTQFDSTQMVDDLEKEMKSYDHKS